MLSFITNLFVSNYNNIEPQEENHRINTVITIHIHIYLIIICKYKIWHDCICRWPHTDAAGSFYHRLTSLWWVWSWRIWTLPPVSVPSSSSYPPAAATCSITLSTGCHTAVTLLHIGRHLTKYLTFIHMYWFDGMHQYIYIYIYIHIYIYTHTCI